VLKLVNNKLILKNEYNNHIYDINDLKNKDIYIFNTNKNTFNEYEKLMNQHEEYKQKFDFYLLTIIYDLHLKLVYPIENFKTAITNCDVVSIQLVNLNKIKFNNELLINYLSNNVQDLLQEKFNFHSFFRFLSYTYLNEEQIIAILKQGKFKYMN